MMKDYIHNEAIRCGFSLCGITTAKPVDELMHLEKAIAEGRTAAMSYLARDPSARCDPRSLMPEARSVICCAMAYRFASGADYHAEMRLRLAKLWDSIRLRQPFARAKICVDANPVLEKALAQRAGLGWIGKHTVLVNEKLGSWFVLGEIVTDLEIEPDSPHGDLCGECVRCVNACPMNAIVSPHALDSRKCLSYYTTGDRGSLPDEIRLVISSDAFGCDICQEACPYNGVGRI